ncbi:MAG: hydrogenase accessory protein HypB [Dethiobacter sp.]|jgi:hydrogenase nickel incorporation protein HypB|nr:MAG: hydrogenase accessory protein HypB [Dethiobacter sp.]
MKIYLARELQEANKNNAEDNRTLLLKNGVLMVNIIGSPGSGKTALLEQTLKALNNKYRIGVIEGDLYTAEDAKRLEQRAYQVLQINTEGSCHLEANYIGHLLNQNNSSLLSADIIFIENIGNLVCPAEFDLGEDVRVSVLSVTEGNDKPRKYPLAFKVSDATLITKTDLLPYCDFNLDLTLRDMQKINDSSEVIPISIKTGEGLKNWCQWLEKQLDIKKKRHVCS